MFKKLIPVVALALIAGPVFAADAPASTPASTDQASTASSKHHKSSKHSKHSKKSTTDASSSAPAK